jgi:hypothetical protein
MPHWVPLVVADRIGVVEGIVDDLKQGHIPNIFAERGWGAEWKYNRDGMIKNIADRVGIAAGAYDFVIAKEKTWQRVKRFNRYVLGGPEGAQAITHY